MTEAGSRGDSRVVGDQKQASQIAVELERLHGHAERLLSDREAVEKQLVEARARGQGSRTLHDLLSPLRRLIGAHIHGSYPSADEDDVAWALAAAMYVASAWDLAPDHLPAGLRDDEMAVAWTLEHIEDTLIRFEEWERIPGKHP